LVIDPDFPVEFPALSTRKLRKNPFPLKSLYGAV